MAGPTNPTVAKYDPPVNFEGTPVMAVPAGYIKGYVLRVSTAPDMSNARVFTDTNIEPGQQTTPLPQSDPPGQYYATVAALTANGEERAGAADPYQVVRTVEAPRNFSLA